MRLLPHLLTLALLASTLFGQETNPPATPQDPAPTVQDIEARINATQAAEDLTDEQKAAVVEALQEALAMVRRGDQAKAEAEAFAQERAAAPAELERIRALLAEPGTEPQPDPSPEDDLQDLAERAAAQRATADTVAAALATVTQEVQTRPTRRASLPQLIADVQAEQAALVAPPEPDPADPARLAVARQMRYRAAQYDAEQRVASLQSELQRDELTRDLLTAQRDLAARRASAADALASAWEALAQTRREAEAEAAARRAAEAVEEAARSHPLVAALAAENQVLANRRNAITASLQSADEDKKEVEAELAKLQTDSENIERQKEIADGLTEAIGVLLRDRLDELPDTRIYDRRNAARRAEQGEVLLRLDQLEQQRQDLVDDLDGYLEARLESFPVPEAERGPLRPRARELLETRLTNLQDLMRDERAYQDKLVDVDSAEKQLLREFEEYERFITENVLWIRSTQPVWQPETGDFGEAVAWLLVPSQWVKAGIELAVDAADLGSSPLVPAGIVFLLLLVLRRRMLAKIQALGVRAGSVANVSFTPTFNTLVLTLLLAAPLPLMLWLCGQRLLDNPEHADFTAAVGGGLQAVTWSFFLYGLFRETLRPGALAEAHFGWSSRSLGVFLANLRWLFPIAVLMNFPVGILTTHGDGEWIGSGGRVALAINMLALTVFFWRLLHPRTGIRATGGPRSSSWYDRFQKLWFVIGVGLPASLLILNLIGFAFTSRQLLLHFRETLFLVVVAVFVNALVLRLLALSKRKLAIKQAREQMALASAKGEGGAEPPPPPPRLDLSVTDLQTRKLLRAGLTLFVLIGSWGIWADVLPALRYLDTLVLWGDTSVDPPVNVTVASLLICLVWVIMTILAARNVPGALEMLLLQRLKIRPGERNAITTITRYTILLVGLIGGFAAIGVGWSNVQWLATAVSVGLGFGLQEIFANFVSGLIILLERPVRVGDLVTVGTTTVGTTDGFVTRIQMRATTVTDFDRRELIIPNKQFITGAIINWSLSDPMLRVVVKVGLAFGSDVEQAKKLLVDIASAHPLILKKPEPKAVFKRFGEHTLDLELWAYLPSRDERVQASDDLHTTIDKALREAGLEIAVPKRDIVVQTEQPSEWMRQPSGRAASPAPAER